LGTSSCNHGSGFQTLNLGFEKKEEEEEEEGWDLVREPEVLFRQIDTHTHHTVAFIYKMLSKIWENKNGVI
jgi:hypothetical protein